MSDNTVIQYLKRSLLRFLLLTVSALAGHQYCASETADSLYVIYMNSAEPHKANAANNLFRQLYSTHFCDTLLQFGKKDKPDVIGSYVHYWMAEYYYSDGQYQTSLDAGNRAYSLMSAVKDDYFKSDVLGTIGNAQVRLGNYDDALRTTLQAYNLDRELKDNELISSDLNTFACIYLSVQQPEPGIKYIEKSIDIERKLKRPDRLAIRLGIASELYLLNGEYNKAMEAIQEAYDIDHQAGRKEKVAIRLVQKGAILEKMSRLSEARTYIMQAVPVLEEADITYSLAIAFNQLGLIESKLGNRSQAIEYYKKALELSIKCGSPVTERTAERGLWETMRETNPTVAMLHLERYTTLNDSLSNKAISAQLKVMAATTQHIEENELTKENEHIRNFLKWGGFALVLLLLASLAGLFLSWRGNKKALKIQRQTQDMRSYFLTNITNEIQTPLTVIMSAGEQLLEGGRTNADETKRIGEMIVKHGKKMLGLVNQILDIEKAKTKIEQPELRNGNIVMFVRMLVENFTNEAHQHLITLEFSSAMTSLYMDFPTDYVRKIIHSLISNAITYTPRNGRVTVSLSRPEVDHINLIVSDTGKGIPVDERERIFEPFYQSVNGDDGVGTGVELSLVRQLVQSMNGSISVDTELGVGTTFTITIPCNNASEEVPILERNAHHMVENLVTQTGDSSRKPLVFIVENTEDVAFFIASHLSTDYDLRFARDGREALNNAQSLVPNLIITDISMPVMGGKQLMRMLRSDSSLNHIPIIAMTSVTSEQERMSCIQAGADFVLIKPFNSNELKIIAQHLINQRSSLRDRYVKTDSRINSEPATNTAMSKEDKDFINRLIDVIHAHMAKEDIDMEHIAAALSLSRKQLRTRVMAITGLTPVAYVLQVRLNHARRMIMNENTSLTTIANKCGFQNLSHFSKAFKQQFGVSPLQFRKNMDDISHTQTQT